MRNPRLTDSSGRHIHKLRVSLSDACNYRCFYCMPERAKFIPQKSHLDADELEFICRNMVLQGIDFIRLTGGEPTLRHDFSDIVQRLAKIENVALGLTTNGQTLDRHLDLLENCGLKKINISLDSLDPDIFRKLTLHGNLETVLRNIGLAVERGFEVKTNTVVFRDLNLGGLCDILRWGEKMHVEVRFLELMRIGVVLQQSPDQLVSCGEMLDLFAPFSPELLPVAPDSTSLRFRTLSGGHFGIIASETRPFCGSCSRLRLTSTGELRSCLMKSSGLSLKGCSEDEIRTRVLEVLPDKPTDRIVEVAHAMHSIGG